MTTDIGSSNNNNSKDWDGDLATLGLSKLLDGDLSDTELHGTYGIHQGVSSYYYGETRIIYLIFKEEQHCDGCSVEVMGKN